MPSSRLAAREDEAERSCSGLGKRGGGGCAGDGAAMQQGGSSGEDERERMRGSGGVGDGRWGSPLLAALERETRERSGEMGIEDDPDRDEWLAAEWGTRGRDRVAGVGARVFRCGWA